MSECFTPHHESEKRNILVEREPSRNLLESFGVFDISNWQSSRIEDIYPEIEDKARARGADYITFKAIWDEYHRLSDEFILQDAAEQDPFPSSKALNNSSQADTSYLTSVTGSRLSELRSGLGVDNCVGETTDPDFHGEYEAEDSDVGGLSLFWEQNFKGIPQNSTLYQVLDLYRSQSTSISNTDLADIGEILPLSKGNIELRFQWLDVSRYITPGVNFGTIGESLRYQVKNDTDLFSRQEREHGKNYEGYTPVSYSGAKGKEIEFTLLDGTKISTTLGFSGNEVALISINNVQAKGQVVQISEELHDQVYVHGTFPDSKVYKFSRANKTIKVPFDPTNTQVTKDVLFALHNLGEALK